MIYTNRLKINDNFYQFEYCYGNRNIEMIPHRIGLNAVHLYFYRIDIRPI